MLHKPELDAIIVTKVVNDALVAQTPDAVLASGIAVVKAQDEEQRPEQAATIWMAVVTAADDEQIPEAAVRQ